MGNFGVFQPAEFDHAQESFLKHYHYLYLLRANQPHVTLMLSRQDLGIISEVNATIATLYEMCQEVDLGPILTSDGSIGRKAAAELVYSQLALLHRGSGLDMFHAVIEPSQTMQGAGELYPIRSAPPTIDALQGFRYFLHRVGTMLVQIATPWPQRREQYHYFFRSFPW
jgi:hypothetical protein